MPSDILHAVVSPLGEVDAPQSASAHETRVGAEAVEVNVPAVVEELAANPNMIKGGARRAAASSNGEVYAAE